MFFLIIFLLQIFILFFLSQMLTRSFSSLIFKLSKNRKITIQLLALFFLPGVIIHELSHFFAASVLFVRTGKIEFVPKLTEGGVKLGSVEVEKTDMLRRMMIGVAPMIIGMVIIFSLVLYLIPNISLSNPNFIPIKLELVWSNIFPLLKTPLIWKVLIVLYFIFEISNTMFSSKKDLEGAIEFLGTLVIMGAIFYFSGISIPENILKSLDVNRISEFVKLADIFLLVPLILDLIFIGVMKVFLR